MHRVCVSTLTSYAPDRVDSFARCTASVECRLGDVAAHRVTHCAHHEDFIDARWESLHAAEFVLSVDDDDYLDGALDSIAQAVAIADQSGAAVVFANSCDPVPRDALAVWPAHCYTFALVRRTALDGAMLTLARRHGVGIDWITRAVCAMRGGSVWLPHQWYRLGQERRERMFYRMARVWGRELPAMRAAVARMGAATREALTVQNFLPPSASRAARV